MMEDHVIRLRGGWFREELDDGHGRIRVTLPVVWPDELTGVVTLLREFQRPPIDTDQQSIMLRLDDVPGLRSVEFNGTILARPKNETTRDSFDLTNRIGDRNRLRLEVDVALARLEPGSHWGVIALVIGTRGSTA